MKRIALAVLLLALGGAAGFWGGRAYQAGRASSIGPDAIAAAEHLFGLRFTDPQRALMVEDLKDQEASYRKLRDVAIPNSVPPALVFQLLPDGSRLPADARRPIELSPPVRTAVPGRPEDLAYFTVRDLGELLRARRITSEALTRLCLARLKKYDPQLHCVITLTEERALEQARRADAEIAAGKYRGPLHGIPYGAKDLLAVQGYRTTWGSVPYKDQTIDDTATVIRKLDEAGAVLVAKTSVGELAWGDVWFGGTTRSPWNLAEGSSGSSAGSAAATSAGLVPFAIGTETWGSIVSPCTRCGVTGLRPTFGRVSRAGAMALSWSMDKIGPITRSVEDCAIVLDAIRGSDPRDAAAVDAPFHYVPKASLQGLRIGFLEKDFQGDYPARANDAAVLAKLRELGADLVPIQLPDYPAESMAFILSAEAGAAFSDLTLSGRDALMVRQVRDAWPNVFRASRFIPAVEYIQANRARHGLVQAMARLMGDVDLYVAPSVEGNNLLVTNLTGHPCVVVPTGFDKKGMPTTISFNGRLYDEATVLAVAKIWQDATGFHLKHPPKFQ